MTKQIIAFFASTLLSVSLNIPATAEEISGVIANVNRDLDLITFQDGNTYRLPQNFNYDAVSPGMEAHVILAADAVRG